VNIILAQNARIESVTVFSVHITSISIDTTPGEQG